jgi:tetratricopeptide (TPR) repeat protein
MSIEDIRNSLDALEWDLAVEQATSIIDVDEKKVYNVSINQSENEVTIEETDTKVYNVSINQSENKVTVEETDSTSTKKKVYNVSINQSENKVIAVEETKEVTNDSQSKVKAFFFRGLARCFIKDKDGKYQDAIKDLTKAISLIKKSAPSSEKNTSNQTQDTSDDLIKNGKYKEAIESLINKALELIKNSAPLSEEVIDDLTKAISLIRNIIPPSEAECRCRRAYAYRLANRFDDAIADCNWVIKGEKKDKWVASAYELLGIVYEELGDMRRAVESYQAAMKLNRDNPSLIERYIFSRDKFNNGR